VIGGSGDGAPDLQWLGPAVTGAAAVVVAALGTIGLVWRRRQDRQAETEAQVAGKQATEADEWSEVRLARQEATKYYNHYTTFRGLFYDVQQALRHLVRKLRDAHPDMNLDKDVVDALALKPEADDTKSNTP
jgi:lysophospholipase L1-like esterase